MIFPLSLVNIGSIAQIEVKHRSYKLIPLIVIVLQWNRNDQQLINFKSSTRPISLTLVLSLSTQAREGRHRKASSDHKPFSGGAPRWAIKEIKTIKAPSLVGDGMQISDGGLLEEVISVNWMQFWR